MKKKILFILLFIFIIIIFIIILNNNYDPYKIPNNAYINLNNNKFLVYDNIKNTDLIKNSNVYIDEQLIKTDEIGYHTYTLDYKFNNRKYKLNIEYEVIDNISPIFINASNDITVLVNEKDNLCNKISYADNYDNTPNCKVFGEYNLNRIGIYKNLEFEITDSSFNKKNMKFNLNVVNSIKNNKDTHNYKYIYIDEIIKKYKTDNTEIGIDISKWQGNIDFNKVKNSGIEFVIIRIGFQKEYDKEIEIDPKFEEYYNNAKKMGFKIGVYVYNTSISKNDGIKTSNWVIKNLNDKKIDFPIAYDFENWKEFQKYKISLHTLSDAYLEFEKNLKENNYDSMLYSSKYYLENVWMNYENSNIWLAHYTNNTDYKGNYIMWQRTNLAKLDGIDDNTVDIDIFYKK